MLVRKLLVSPVKRGGVRIGDRIGAEFRRMLTHQDAPLMLPAGHRLHLDDAGELLAVRLVDLRCWLPMPRLAADRLTLAGRHSAKRLRYSRTHMELARK